jgi:hypothetical protein
MTWRPQRTAAICLAVALAEGITVGGDGPFWVASIGDRHVLTLVRNP